MVNISSAAHAAVTAYGAAIALGGNYSYPLPKLADTVSSFFLPNYTAYTLGKQSLSPNQSVVALGFEKTYTGWRKSGGPGTVVKIIHTNVQPVSNESALCWLTYHIQPQNGMLPWSWTNVYGYRMTEKTLLTKLKGGWEFAIGDDEHLQYDQRLG
jgi:hypothetical protein